MSSRPAPARPRTPALVLGAVVVAVAVLVAAVALTSRQQTPPTIAEFAPQAVAQIKQTLDEQSENDPARTGAGTAGGQTPPPTTPPSTAPDGSPLPQPGASPPTTEIVKPRVRDCIGTPPRQTEDPQSPPCVPYFDPDIDNGGATSKGVTGDAITIAVPQQFLEDLNPPQKMAQGYFNKRYEFYGRQINLVPYGTTGCVEGQPDPAKMRADAVLVDEEVNAFATLAYANCQAADHHYYDALAERKVLSIADGNLTTGVEKNYAKRAPYQWNVMAGVDTITATTADFVCSSLAGRRPAHAGAQQATASVRKFGVITTRSTDGTTPDLALLRSGLQQCGVTLVEKRDDQTSSAARSGVNTMVALQDEGVTSVLCLCNSPDLRNVYMTAASAQGYQPEWVQSSYINTDLDNTYGGGNAPPDQSAHVIGISFRNKLSRRQDMPWYNAVKEADPTFEPSAGSYYSSHSRYMQLSLLAAGIQLAGPELTPETFAQGLHRAQFANPGAGTGPFFQSRVGFAGPRHVMSVDAGMFWFDPQQPGTIDASVPGAICYVDRGRRYVLGAWPKGEPAFRRGPCL